MSLDELIDDYHYRDATTAHDCGNCVFYGSGHCTMVEGNPEVDPDHVCDAWQGNVDKEQTPLDHQDPDVQRQVEHLTSGFVAKDSGGALYLVRHGSTKFNQDANKRTDDLIRGWIDVPLTPKGRHEARQVSKLLLGNGITSLTSSDLVRASETADIIGKRLGLKNKTTKGLRPWNLGDHQGKPSKDAVPHIKRMATKNKDEKAPDGESFNDFSGRAKKEVMGLLARVKKGERIAAVTHYRVLKYTEALLQKDPSLFFTDDTDPGAVIVITPDSRGNFVWSKLTTGAIEKAANADMLLSVIGVGSHPSGQRVYRLATRDGHYMGRTNPTKVRAVKGDVIKVTAAHITRSDSGDLYWQNVAVHNLERKWNRADSRRDILHRIGGGNVTSDMTLLDKDNATPVPPAGDTGTVDPDELDNVPMGPTANSAHVNRPLKNISQFYGKRKIVAKAWNDDKQILYGVVLEPDVFDKQGDIVPRAEVEKAAHNYLKKVSRGKASVSKLRHRLPAFSQTKNSVVPVESFIAPCDFTYEGSDEPVKKGTWVVALHIEDPGVWQDVKDGLYDGLSIGGTGKRQPISM